VLGWVRSRRVTGWTGRRRGNRTFTTSAAVLLLLVLVAITAGRATLPSRAGDPQVGGGDDKPPGFAAAPGASRRAARSATPAHRPEAVATGSVATPSQPAGSGVPASAAAAPLRAVHSVTATGPVSYSSQITITNPGPAAADGWLVSFTPSLLNTAVTAADGAKFEQLGNVVTFTPEASTRVVPPGGTVSFVFVVTGPPGPAECSIDARPCDEAA
jgi:hypothetical protein